MIDAFLGARAAAIDHGAGPDRRREGRAADDDNVVDNHSARDARAAAAALAIAYRGRALGLAQTQRLASAKRRQPRDDRILEEAMATVG